MSFIYITQLDKNVCASRVGSHQTCTGTLLCLLLVLLLEGSHAFLMQMVHNFDHRGAPFQNQMPVSEYCAYIYIYT